MYTQIYEYIGAFWLVFGHILHQNQDYILTQLRNEHYLI